MWNKGQSTRLVSRYLVAVLSVALVFLLRLALAPILNERFPYILFSIAVMVSTFYGGVRPGLLSGALSIVLGHVFFVNPYPALMLEKTADGIAIVLFIAFTGTINLIGYRLRQATTQAAEGEKRMSEVLESIADNFIALDREWRFVYINRAAEAVMQRPREDLLGKNIWAEYPKMNGSRMGNLYREVYRTHAPSHLEHFHRATKTWFEVNVYPSKQGGISVYFLDITRRKQHEAAAARLAAVVESSDDAIMSVTADGLIQSWNDGAVRLYGHTAEEAIGRSIYILLPPDRQDEETGLLERMRQGEHIDHFETDRIRQGWNSRTGFPFPLADPRSWRRGHRHVGYRARRDGARRVRGTTAADAEAGEPGSAGGRGGARLQQPAGRQSWATPAWPWIACRISIRAAASERSDPRPANGLPT